MKKIVLLLIVFFILPLSLFASEVREALDDLVLYDLEISAVTTDMALYLGWLPQDKKEMRKASKKATYELNIILDNLARMKTPEALRPLKNSQIDIIKELRSIYKDVDKKEQKAIDEEFISFNPAKDKYSSNLANALESSPRIKDIPEDFEFLEEELKLIGSKEDKVYYLKLLKLMEEKKFKDAYEGLTKLKAAYENKPFAQCLMVKMSDCLLHVDSDIVDFDADTKIDEGIDLLLKIVNSKEYSPVLSEAFYKWRTSVQQHRYGMSNLARIPNQLYNQQRIRAIKNIKAYLNSHPEDLWAEMQLDILFGLSNINRGGTLGNDNILHWAALYTDIEDNIDLGKVVTAAEDK